MTYGQLSALEWRALEMIRSRAREPGIRLGEIASSLGRSRSWLSHLLKRRTGQAFWEHVDRLRVDEAKAHLENPALTIKEAAARVGWTTAQLDFHFRRLVGTTPTAWRAGQNRLGRNPG